jgi:hypothetical protein
MPTRLDGFMPEQLDDESNDASIPRAQAQIAGSAPVDGCTHSSADIVMEESTMRSMAVMLADLPSLQASGLEFRCVERRPPTQAIGESYVLHFSNGRRRSLDAIFYSQPSGMDFFLINIVNDELQDTFALHNWMKKHAVYDETRNRFVLSSYSGEFGEKLASFLSYLDGVLRDDAMQSILNGRSWEKVFFDWAGMR